MSYNELGERTMEDPIFLNQTDDSMAIFMAFQSPQLEVLGLTTISGNVTIEDATRNALLLGQCEIAGCPGLPVAEGPPEPLKFLYRLSMSSSSKSSSSESEQSSSNSSSSDETHATLKMRVIPDPPASWHPPGSLPTTSRSSSSSHGSVSAAVDFFNQLNLLYGTLTEFCTPENCPTMTAGPKYEYRWADGVQIKKPMEVSAPKYVEYLMDWIESQLDDESIFPQRLGAPFPPNFREVVKTIFKRLFRVYAHICHSHFQKIEFGLIDKKELAPLQELVESIVVPY
ncbi:hypothetical protein ACSBR2_037352 [Camellia fascicularis]